MRNWLIGRAINLNALRQERADYGKQIVSALGHKLASRFGAGFTRPNLSRMLSFARLYPDYEIIATLSHRRTAKTTTTTSECLTVPCATIV